MFKCNIWKFYWIKCIKLENNWVKIKELKLELVRLDSLKWREFYCEGYVKKEYD